MGIPQTVHRNDVWHATMDLFLSSNHPDDDLPSTVDLSELSANHELSTFIAYENSTVASSSYAIPTDACTNVADVAMPSIFVQIPIDHSCHNHNKSAIKSEPIKSEFSENAAGLQLAARKVPSFTSSNVAPPNLVTARPKAQTKCHKCMRCPYLSISAVRLYRHMETVHGDSGIEMRPHPKIFCPGCDNVFYMRESLEVHLLHDHEMSSDEIQLLLNSIDIYAAPDNPPPNTTNRIYLKNVNNLRNPDYVCENDTSRPNSGGLLTDLLNDSSSVSTSALQPIAEVDERPRNKIFIKNVDILKKPFVPMLSPCHMPVTMISPNPPRCPELASDDMCPPKQVIAVKKLVHDLDFRNIENLSSKASPDYDDCAFRYGNEIATESDAHLQDLVISCDGFETMAFMRSFGSNFEAPDTPTQADLDIMIDGASHSVDDDSLQQLDVQNSLLAYISEKADDIKDNAPVANHDELESQAVTTVAVAGAVAPATIDTFMTTTAMETETTMITGATEPAVSEELVNSLLKGRIYVVDNLTVSKNIFVDEPTTVTSGRSSPPSSRTLRSRTAKKLGRKMCTASLTSAEAGVKCDRDTCTVRFRSAATMAIHRRCHATGDTISCPECASTEPISFSNWNTLHTHLWRVHKIDMELYACDRCPFKTPILSRLNNTHAKIHSDERAFKCSQCDKAFKNSKQLKNHRRVHRPTGELVIRRCDHCSASFSTVKSLRLHMEAAHTGIDHRMPVTEHKCTECGQTMATRTALRTHLLKHGTEQRYTCPNEECTYTSNDHNSFRRHRMTHDKTAPAYRCPYCDYTSIQSNAYRKHLLKRHPAEASNLIYMCAHCSFATISRFKYTVHCSRHRHEHSDSLDLSSAASVASVSTVSTVSTATGADSCDLSEVIFVGTDDYLTAIDQSTTTPSPVAIPVACSPTKKNKIKVKSNLVLADPSKFIDTNNFLLRNLNPNQMIRPTPSPPVMLTTASPVSMIDTTTARAAGKHCGTIRTAVFANNFSNIENSKVLDFMPCVEPNSLHCGAISTSAGGCYLNIDLT